MGMIFCKNSFIGELLSIFGFMGILFREFPVFLGPYFYDLYDITPYLGN